MLKLRTIIYYTLISWLLRIGIFIGIFPAIIPVLLYYKITGKTSGLEGLGSILKRSSQISFIIYLIALVYSIYIVSPILIPILLSIGSVCSVSVSFYLTKKSRHYV